MTYRDLVEHSWKHSSLQHWYSHSESKLCSIGLCKSQLRWNIRFSCIGTIAKLKVNNFWNIKGWRGFLCISLLKTGKLSLFGCGSRQFSCVTIWCGLRQLSCVFHLPFGIYSIQAKQHFLLKLRVVTGSSYCCALHALFLSLLTGMSQNSALYHRKNKPSRRK